MDITDFYKQARSWQDQQEEAERLAAREQQTRTNDEWKKIAAVIRLALPIEDMTIHETYAGQFKELPRKGVIWAVDCLIDQLYREDMQYPMSDSRRLMLGVIRVQVVIDDEQEDRGWKIYQYEVWVNGTCTRFDNPYSAFLAAYKELGKEFIRN